MQKGVYIDVLSCNGFIEKKVNDTPGLILNIRAMSNISKKGALKISPPPCSHIFKRIYSKIFLKQCFMKEGKIKKSEVLLVYIRAWTKILRFLKIDEKRLCLKLSAYSFLCKHQYLTTV